MSSKTSNLQLDLSNCGYEVWHNYYVNTTKQNITHSRKSSFLSTYERQEHCSGSSKYCSWPQRAYSPGEGRETPSGTVFGRRASGGQTASAKAQREEARSAQKRREC